MSSEQKVTAARTEAPKVAEAPRMPVAQSPNGAAVGLVVRMADAPKSAHELPPRALQEWPSPIGLRVGR
jgi:hypothetical protein